MNAGKERGWVDHQGLVDYYASHRNQANELYPSERRFLPWLAGSGESVLDVGCGAGGFAGVWQSLNPSLRYTGVDLSPALIDVARRQHPGHEFVQADCADGLPFEDRSFDIVAALGWLHWEPRHEAALAELWRVCRRQVFFDLRLVAGDGSPVTGEQRIALNGGWDGRTTVPYLCLPWESVARRLLELAPARILAHGYWGEPADTVVGVDGQVCFATFVLERPGATAPARPALELELPLEWPQALADRVEVNAR